MSKLMGLVILIALVSFGVVADQGSVQSIIRDLKSEYPNVVQSALNRVAQLGAEAEPATPYLLQMIKDDPMKQTAIDASRILATMGPNAAAAAVPVLVEIIFSGEGVSLNLLWSLTDYGTDASMAIPYLVSRLDAPELIVSRSMILVLAAVGQGDEIAQEALRRVAEGHQDIYGRALAQFALDLWPSVLVDAVLNHLVVIGMTPEQVTMAIYGPGSKSPFPVPVQYLLDISEGWHHPPGGRLLLQQSVVVDIEVYETPSAWDIPKLYDDFRALEAWRRARAVNSMAWAKDDLTFSWLQTALDDPEPLVVANAIWALHRRGHVFRQSEVEKYLDDPVVGFHARRALPNK